MSATPEVTVSASTFPNILAIPVQTNIGGIAVECAVDQRHRDRQDITEHPVEYGADMTDHAINRAGEFTLRCGWSNASIQALQGIVSGVTSGGIMSAGSYIDGIYNQLLALQKSRQIFAVSTIRRQYPVCLMLDISLYTDEKFQQAILVEMEFREIILVSTSTSPIPTQDAQADPSKTAEVQLNGTTSPLIAIPPPASYITGPLAFTK